MASTTERMQQYADQGAEQARGMTQQAHGYVEQGASSLSSDVFLFAAGASVMASLALNLSGKRDQALFVGQWAPTLVGLAIYTKVVQRSGV